MAMLMRRRNNHVVMRHKKTDSDLEVWTLALETCGFPMCFQDKVGTRSVWVQTLRKG